MPKTYRFSLPGHRTYRQKEERLRNGGLGGTVRDAPWRKFGGGGFCDDNDAFARVYNNLLLHEYIYYFTPVHF